MNVCGFYYYTNQLVECVTSREYLLDSAYIIKMTFFQKQLLSMDHAKGEL